MPFWSKKSVPAPAPTFKAYTPELCECKDSFACIGLDEKNKLWLLFLEKRDYQNFSNDQHHLRRIRERYAIVGVDKRLSGGILVYAKSEAGTTLIYHLERTISGNIIWQCKDLTAVLMATRMPQRVFLKQGHPEYDMLECLFNPHAT